MINGIALDEWIVHANGVYYGITGGDYQTCRQAGVFGKLYASRLFNFLRERGALQSGCRILEISPGEGGATSDFLAYASRIPGLRYFCADFSEENLNRVRSRLGDSGVVLKKAVVGTGEQLPFPEAHFDVCLTNELFDDLPVMVTRKCGAESLHAFSGGNGCGFEWKFSPSTPEERRRMNDYSAARSIRLGEEQVMLYTGVINALKEIRRVLKPGGFLYAMDYVCWDRNTPKQPYCIDHRFPVANVTTPVNINLFTDGIGMEPVHSSSFSDFFKGTEEGETPVEADIWSGMIYETKTGTPLWRFSIERKAQWIPDLEYWTLLLRNG